ncbi:MAG: DNA-binding XRE family transcriptional regulator [Candidatus Omnitrophota bacterium]|jgi:DNA-binding XRE family transcriptional regulator
MGKGIFWDISLSVKAVQAILSQPSHEKFAYLTALILSRTTDVKEVFAKYITQENFVRHWRIIKRRLKENKWNDNVAYWDLVHSSLYKQLKKKGAIGIIKPSSRIENAKLHEISEFIKASRKAKKWSQADLAKKVLSTQQSISNLERGQIDFSVNTLLKVIDALDLNLILEQDHANTNMIGTYSISKI